MVFLWRPTADAILATGSLMTSLKRRMISTSRCPSGGRRVFLSLLIGFMTFATIGANVTSRANEDLDKAKGSLPTESNSMQWNGSTKPSCSGFTGGLCKQMTSHAMSLCYTTKNKLRTPRANSICACSKHLPPSGMDGRPPRTSLASHHRGNSMRHRWEPPPLRRNTTTQGKPVMLTTFDLRLAGVWPGRCSVG